MRIIFKKYMITPEKKIEPVKEPNESKLILSIISH